MFSQKKAFLIFSQKKYFLIFSQKKAFLIFSQKKSFLIFSEKKAFLIFSQKKAFLIFSQKKASLIFPEMERCTFHLKLEKIKNNQLQKNYLYFKKQKPKKLLTFQETSYISGSIFQSSKNEKNLLKTDFKVQSLLVSFKNQLMYVIVFIWVLSLESSE